MIITEKVHEEEEEEEDVEKKNRRRRRSTSKKKRKEMLMLMMMKKKKIKQYIYTRKLKKTNQCKYIYIFDAELLRASFFRAGGGGGVAMVE